VLLFDTLFHQTLPKEVYSYAIPPQESGALDRSIPLRKVSSPHLPFTRKATFSDDERFDAIVRVPRVELYEYPRSYGQEAEQEGRRGQHRRRASR
jgi:hypothetical protein